MTESLRLADLLGGLSMVNDLGFGLSPHTAMRSCVVSTQFARVLDLDERRVHDTFYAALLMHIGCVGMSLEGYRAFGHEIQLTRAWSDYNVNDWREMPKLVPAVTQGLPARERVTAAAFAVTRGPAWGRAADRGSCEIAREVARRLRLPVPTQRALDQVFEWWNGKGAHGLAGDDIDVVARLVLIAADAVHFDEAGGDALVRRQLRARTGMLDPDLVERFVDRADELLADVRHGDPRELILQIEPTPVVQRRPDELAEVAAIFGDATDMKAPTFHGHAQRVAAIARAAGEGMGLAAQDVAQLHVAALLHDVGRCGVPLRVWEKAGPLTAAEWEQVRLHAYHSERILSACEALAPMARLAGQHHERPDGTGYHRGARAGEIPMAARVLAVADAFCAMTAGRPYRSALAPARAAEMLGAEAEASRRDPDAVTAVLKAAGHTPRRTASRPSGLTEREVDVLRLVAEGLSNAAVAQRLHISRRTAEHHIQHIYSKIGVSTRAGAAMFGLEHGLLLGRRATAR